MVLRCSRSGIAYTVNYDLSDMEAELYAAVTDYVQEEFNRADNLNNDRRTTVGFALTILQRRLASSPEAIYQSLRRRRERLEHRLAEERLGKRGAEITGDFEPRFRRCYHCGAGGGNQNPETTGADGQSSPYQRY